MYKKTSQISRLPAYLAVQFVRFFVGKAPDSEEVVQKKILKVGMCVWCVCEREGGREGGREKREGGSEACSPT